MAVRIHPPAVDRDLLLLVGVRDLDKRIGGDPAGQNRIRRRPRRVHHDLRQHHVSRRVVRPRRRPPEPMHRSTDRAASATPPGVPAARATSPWHSPYHLVTPFAACALPSLHPPIIPSIQLSGSSGAGSRSRPARSAPDPTASVQKWRFVAAVSDVPSPAVRSTLATPTTGDCRRRTDAGSPSRTASEAPNVAEPKVGSPRTSENQQSTGMPDDSDERFSNSLRISTSSVVCVGSRFSKSISARAPARGSC